METDDQSKASDQAPSVSRDQSGSPGTDQKRETPPPVRSARAENSSDPNDDPNRIGTPRADSLAIARGEKLGTDANESDASDTAPSDTAKARPDEVFEVEDGKPPAETGGQPREAPPVQSGHGDFEEPESPIGDQNQLGPDILAQEPADEGTGGSGDGGQDHGKKSEDPAEPSVPEEAKDPFSGEKDAGPDLEEAGEDTRAGEDPERERLYAFGNKKMPKLTRLDRDLRVESSDEIVGPYAPESPTDRVLGKSTYIDPAMAPLTGHYHVLAPDAEMPPGLGIHADGEDAGGIAPWGHRTIYPTEPMTAGEFTDRGAALEWEWAGNKKR